jgi:hypothetical protein
VSEAAADSLRLQFERNTGAQPRSILSPFVS